MWWPFFGRWQHPFLDSFAAIQDPAANPGSCPLSALLCGLAWVLPGILNRQSLSDTFSPFDIIDDTHYDYIVVGAGTAGCIVASRLSEIGNWKVLLLEAGGEEPLLADVPAFLSFNWETRLDWQYRTQPQPNACGNEPCLWNAGKVLGGTTVLNGMIYNRGSPRTYDEWAELGNEGWSFKDVLPFFKVSENNFDPEFATNTKYHATGGLQSIKRLPLHDKNVEPLLEAFSELGYNNIDFNGGHQLGVMQAQFYQYGGTRRSAYSSFILPFRGRRKNLQVVTNVRVTKVLINSDKTAHGIEYAWDKFRLLTGKLYADKEVIVCAGTLSSPKVLMLSGIGPRKILEKAGIEVVQDLPVGQSLQDHVTTSGFTFKLPQDRVVSSDDDKFVGDIYKYIGLHNGSFASVGTLEVTAYINSRYADPNIDYPDIQYFLPPMYMYKTTEGLTPFKAPFSDYNTINVQPGVMKPKSMGHFTIKDKDPFSDSLIYPNSFENEEDLNVIIDACNFLAKDLANTQVFKDLGITVNSDPLPRCVHLDFGTDDYWRCLAKNYTLTLHHFTGTCKMGPEKDQLAVVDPELRVYGVKNLRVADASVMPTSPNGNTQAPTQMIAEKVSYFIKNTWLPAKK